MSIRSSLLVGAAVVLISGCGGDGDKSSSEPANSPGAKVFSDAGCGGCHALSAVDAKGTVGPDLDQVKPEKEKVAMQVRNGGVGMPSFSDKLSADEIDDVAVFVADATRKATGGGSVAAGYEPDDTKLEDCAAGDNRCYEQAFANVAYNDGPDAALDLFDEQIATPGPIEADCHRIAHAIGGGALKHYDGEVGQAFVAGRPSCTSGYYHGILERAFLGIPQEELGEASRMFCADPEIRKTDFIAYQCVHGLGHGLMIYTGYDLAGSLKTCDELGPGDGFSCTGGVFMENYQASYGVKSRWLKDDDLIYPCNAVAERHKYFCYDLVTARILPKVKYNWSKAAKVCRTSEPKWVKVCFESLGRDASGFTRLDAARILDICKVGKEFATQCIYAAAKDMTYTDVKADRAKGLCNTAPASTRDHCWQGIGEILGSLDRDHAKRKALCDGATRKPAYLKACYRGAVVT